MRTRWATAATLVCLVLTGFGLTACKNTIELPNSDVDYCTIMADPPSKDGSRIAGPTHFRCDGKGATSLTLTVTLQKQSHSGWKSLKKHTFVVYGVDTSRAKSEDSRTRKVYAACGTGEYRTVLHAVEKSKGHAQTFNMHSVSAPNPCKTSFS